MRIGFHRSRCRTDERIAGRAKDGLDLNRKNGSLRGLHVGQCLIPKGGGRIVHDFLSLPTQNGGKQKTKNRENQE